MVARKNTLPYTPIGEFMAQETGKRISHSAKVEVELVLDELCEKIIPLANAISQHSKRTTLKGEDIEIAYKQIKGGAY